MSNLEFLLLLVCSFAGCAFLAYVLMRWLQPHSALLPLEGSILRVKCAHGVFRSRLIAIDAKGWRIAAPISRDNFVPLRPGEKLVVEAPVSGGALLTHTTVLERPGEGNELLLARPSRATKLERRETERRTDLRGTCTVERLSATLLDISSYGARLWCSVRVAAGDRIRIDLPWIEEPVFAWVLEIVPAPDQGASRTLCRVRFEERLRLPSSAIQASTATPELTRI